MDRTAKIILFVFLGVFCFCLFIAIICGGSVFLVNLLPNLKSEISATSIFQTTEPQALVTPVILETPEVDLLQTDETLKILQSAVIPSANQVELTERFTGQKDIPSALTTDPVDYQVGDSLDFWTSNLDTSENKRITAYLVYMTKDVYFWAEDGIYVNNSEVRSLVDTFAEKIYPTDREFFGSEWNPGVDNDPHIYILYATDLGSSVAGYESSADSVLPAVHPYSNVHEMFYMNADVISLSNDYALSVLAHEFQHLIHGYHDPNEETWLNEGFSELATFLNGYSPTGFEYYFAEDADIQLNEWPNDPNSTDVHYGSGFLFTTYLLDRFGEEITKAVVADKKNGLDSIDNVFLTEGIKNPDTGEVMTSNQFFMDWTIANFLNDPSIADGRYSYQTYQNVPYFSSTEYISNCDTGAQDRTVSQYGTDYVQIFCQGEYTISFEGSPTVKILPTSTNEGTHFVWSNKADVSDMTMTQLFDFTEVTDNLDLTYSMWYDIETDYDYVYLLSSTDGETWNMVETPSCSSGNISGNNYGCGYNGSTGGWHQETVDLSDFAGQKVWLRFEYITDTAVTGEGFAIDAVSIPQTGYYSDFETDDGGWELRGFVRIENFIPQTFLVSLIQGTGNESVITKYEIAPGEKVAFNVNDRSGEGVVLVISGSARYSRQKGSYQFSITK